MPPSGGIIQFQILNLSTDAKELLTDIKFPQVSNIWDNDNSKSSYSIYSLSIYSASLWISLILGMFLKAISKQKNHRLCGYRQEVPNSRNAG